MQISIEFLGPQRLAVNGDGIHMPISGDTRVKDALEWLKRKYPDLDLDDHTALITVNQQIASLDHILRPDDTVSFLPFVGGG